MTDNDQEPEAGAVRKANRFEPFMGHTPRDRGSIWYIASILAGVIEALLALIVVGGIIVAVTS